MPRLLLAAALALAAPLAAPAQGRGPDRGPDLDRGLLASYALDGDAVDAITRARAFAQATRPADGHDGRPRGALLFDGARAFVNLGDRLAPERFTVAAWIRPDAVDRPMAIVSKVKNLPGHWQRNLELRVDPGGRLYLQVPSGNAWDGVAGARPLARGRWVHVAAVYDGLRAQLFVDAVRDGAPLETAYAQSRTETFIGARPESGGRDGRSPAGPGFFFAGAIEDVRIWDRPLSDAELRAVVAGPAVRPPPHEPPPVADRPAPSRDAGPEVIARYPLDGDATDAAGRADGTIAGARPAEDRRGDKRGALAFTGREFVDLGERGAPDRFTIAAWVRPNRLARDLVVFSKWSGDDDGDAWLELRVEKGGRVALALPGGDGPRGQGVRSTRKLAANRWTLVAASFDGDRAIVYVDGQPDAEASLLPAAPSRGPVFIGARPDASGRRMRAGSGFDGRIDEVTLWRGVAPDEALAAAARDLHGGASGVDPERLLVAKVDGMVARYDVACARRDPAALAGVEARLAAELEDAARVAQRDRDGAALAGRIRRAAGELQALRGRADGMSLDRKRTALAELSGGLWDDLVRALDDDRGARRDDRREDRGDRRDAGWF